MQRFTKITIFITISLILLANWAMALESRRAHVKPAQTIFGSGVRSDVISVKFIEGSGVRLRNSQLTSLNNTDITPVQQFLAKHSTVDMQRLFSQVSEEKLTQDKLNGQARSGKELPDLNLWYVCKLPHTVNAKAFVDELNSMDLIETAYPAPIPEVASLESKKRQSSPQRDTPDFTDLQGYLYAAPAGVNAEFAWNFEGAMGDNVKWIDIEAGWNWNHEDMPETFFQGGTGGYGDHGVAVVGVVSGVPNDYGITGIAPNAPVGSVGVGMGGWPNISTYLYMTYNNLDEGDVFLIELHSPGPRYDFEWRDDQLGYIAMEWWPENFDVIQTATANGVICVEAAGNGAENFDDEIYLDRFNRELQDSGAIVCGAATAYELSRLDFSNHGSRLDSFGWGRNVTTTGYGDLQAGDVNEWYTDSFSGTSSASPICTGPVIVIQSVLKEMGEDILTPLEMRSLMTETGTPQVGNAENEYIGTRPNLYEALRQIVETGTVTGYVLNSQTGEPVLNAKVELIMPNAATHTIMTDETGYFSFENYFPMEYTLSISRYGYEAYETTITPTINQVTELQVDFTATEMSVLTGNFQDDEGAAVNATAYIYQIDTGLEMLLEQATTTEDGTFTLNLPTGEYDIRIISEFPYSMRQELGYAVCPDCPGLEYNLNPAKVLLVDDDEGASYEQYYFNALNLLGKDYYLVDLTSQELPSMDMLAMMPSPNILWFTGDATETAITTEEGDFLVEALDSGHTLFLTGQNILEYLNGHILQAYLEVMFVENTVGNLMFTFDEDEIGGQLPVTRILDEPGANNQNSCDTFYPFGNAQPIYYHLSGGEEAIGAIHNQSPEEDGHRLVFFGFGFEAIGNPSGVPNIADPEDVMEVVLNWLDGTTSIKDVDFTSIPQKAALHQNYPNPFNPSTTIQFEIPQTSQVLKTCEVYVGIYDISGKLIKALIDGKMEPGYHSIAWNGKDDAGHDVASGVYFYRIKADSFDKTKSMLLLK